MEKVVTTRILDGTPVEIMGIGREKRNLVPNQSRDKIMLIRSVSRKNFILLSFLFLFVTILK